MILDQLKTIDPSAREPLFRRLMSDDKLAYLRDDNQIIGFELDLEDEPVLSGFALIAMHKHTIYIFKSDLDEEPRLILFPTLDKLFDSEFELLDLTVYKRVITDATFEGKSLGHGSFRDMVHDLTPPVKNVDLPEGVFDKVEHPPEPVAPVVESIEHDDDMTDYQDDDMNDYQDDDMNDYQDDDMNDYQDDDMNDYQDEDDEYSEDSSTLADEDPRTIQLRAQTFETFMDVSEYVELRLNVPHSVVTQVANGTLQATTDPDERLNLIIELFAKIFNEKKV